MTNFTSDIDRAAAGYSPDRVGARSDAATGWTGSQDIYLCNANYEALSSMA